MKDKWLIFIMATYASVCMGQQVNVDAFTIAQLTAIEVAVAARIGILIDANKELSDMIRNHKAQLYKNYTKSKYDKNPFFFGSIKTGALSFGTKILELYPNVQYMTANKRKYMNDMAKSKAILLFLQKIDHKGIKAGSRQEIYRLRSEIIREYSKNDKIVRQLMLLPAAAFAVKNKTELLKFLLALKVVL